MHTYLRIIHEQGPESYSTDEQQKLRACLISAPDIETIKEIKQDPKGGYSVTMERTGDKIDSLIAHIRSHGYQVVI